ncbi:serine/threonine-protein kinase haspin-like [Haemaphysalis longicornis]
MRKDDNDGLYRELGNLKNNVDNRTSAFFLGTKTSLVRDKYPKLLWDARLRCQKEYQTTTDGPSWEDLQQEGDYLVTQMQPGWLPLPSYKLSDPEQCASVLSQACWALAVAEADLEFEHRLPGAGGVLVRPTHSPRVEFTLRGRIVRLQSAGIKIRLQRLHMARIRIGKHTCLL